MRPILAILALSLLFVAGCERRDAANAPSPSNSSLGGTGLKVVYIPKSTGNPYFTELSKGFEDACKEMGCEYTMVAPSTADATSQIPFIKSQIQRGVDVIAITPNSPDALNPVLDEAKAKGIVVVCVDADLVGNEDHRAAAVLPTDFSKVGESQVELLGSEIGYKGDFAILSATTDAPNQNVWIAGMKEALKQPKYAGMHLVDTAYGDDEPEKSTTECNGLLSKHPNLRGIISPTSVGLAASAQAIQLAGVYPGGPNAQGAGLVLTGLSTPKQMRGFIDKGVVQAFQLWLPRDMGYLAANLGVGVKRGSIHVGEGNEIRTSPNGAKAVLVQKFEKNDVVYMGPLITFDKSNVGKYDF